MAIAEHPNVVEHHIQVVSRQLLRRGEVVYDVGAHRGWLSVPFAELVGRNGYVLSFEPSRRNLQQLRTVLAQRCPAQAEIVAAAAYSCSGERVELYENAFSATDSLYFKNEDSLSIAVPTVALDDVWRLTGLSPSLIKMDIEGAEADALVGAARLIEEHRPTMILEFRPTDRRPLDWLSERGYDAYKLSDYDRVPPAASLDDMGMLEDLLFVHASRADDERLRFLRNEPAPFEEVGGAVEVRGRETLIRGIPLQRGINCFRVASSMAGPPVEINVQAVQGARCVANFRAYYQQIAAPFLRFVVYAGQPETVDVCILAVSGSEAVQVRSVERRVVRLSAADHRHHAILALVAPFGLTGDQFAGLMQDASENKAWANFELLMERARAEPSLADHPRVLYLAGVRALASGRIEEACDALSRSRDLGFAPYWANLRLAQGLRAAGRPEPALAAAHAARAKSDTEEIRTLIERLAKEAGSTGKGDAPAKA